MRRDPETQIGEEVQGCDGAKARRYKGAKARQCEGTTVRGCEGSKVNKETQVK